MMFKVFIIIILVCFSSTIERVYAHSINNGSHQTIMRLPEHASFNVVTASSGSDCHREMFKNTKKINQDDDEDEDNNKNRVKLHLNHRSDYRKIKIKESVFESTSRDMNRIQTLSTRMLEKKNQNKVSRISQKIVLETKPEVSPETLPELHDSGQLIATLESGVSLGSGEYFIDVFIGKPPKHFSLILDTGSDLNWIQCVPCYDCFEQDGPYYNPKDSSSFRNISCHDPRCQLVSSPDPPESCKDESQTCPYFYWYGDSSNTTGDFALETFTVNLTTITGLSEFKEVENLMFGCGHWNRGLFHGAAGLLGLGRGPLSFASQLQSLYGHSFSYCLVDRNSDPSVSSKLIFGEDKDLLSLKELNYTTLIPGNENPVDTFYYVQIKSVLVGGEVLNIPDHTWSLTADGAGGTIIDSGTTLTYFSDPAYKTIKDMFVTKVKNYQIIENFPILHPCYNVSGVDELELPTFGIQFTDGAVWNFPVENYFIRLDPEEIVCLAILGTPRSAMSIIGNYQQQNFHILYDTKNSRLGFAPRRCADL